MAAFVVSLKLTSQYSELHEKPSFNEIIHKLNVKYAGSEFVHIGHAVRVRHQLVILPFVQPTANTCLV